VNCKASRGYILSGSGEIPIDFFYILSVKIMRYSDCIKHERMFKKVIFMNKPVSQASGRSEFPGEILRYDFEFSNFDKAFIIIVRY
jgi:hypothetical protein